MSDSECSRSIVKVDIMFEYVVIGLLVFISLLAVLQVRRKTAIDLSPLQAYLDSLALAEQRLGQLLRDEIKSFREEFSSSARQDREEAARCFKDFGESMQGSLLQLGQRWAHACQVPGKSR